MHLHPPTAPVGLLAVCLGTALGLGTGPARGQAPELRKVHALLVIDTRSGLGKSPEVDGGTVEHVLTTGLPRDRLDLTVLKDGKVTAEAILRYYRSLSAGPNDALFFYYAGHGAMDPKRGHFLALQELKVEPLLRSDLRHAMQQKRPGLAVIVTDCCSSVFPLPRQSKTRAVHASADAKAVRHLLLQHRGVIDVTGAQKDTSSFGDEYEGGIFTRTFGKLLAEGLRELDANNDGFLSWKEFFPRLQKDTEKTFTTWARTMRARGEDPGQKTQLPFAFELGGAGGSGEVTIRNDLSKPIPYRYRWSGSEPWESVTIPPKGERAFAPPSSGGRPARTMEVLLEGGKTLQLVPGKHYRFGLKKRAIDDNDDTETIPTSGRDD